MGAAHPVLRVYLEIDDLQPQFAAYMATPLRARGYPPFAGENSLIVEVAPALAIHRVADLALKAVAGTWNPAFSSRNVSSAF